MLKQLFLQLVQYYSNDTDIAERLWKEIETAYSHKKRHYHTLQHLENLFNQLVVVKDQINDWNTILFSLYYHDIVYNTLRHDNEEKSALLAEERLQEIGVSQKKIEACHAQILATKNHSFNTDSDTNFFTDADLSILGMDWEVYNNYRREVRQEYSIYPDLVYKPGRKKVLQHFLAMPRIYKTTFFYNLYEARAKQNLQMELNSLQ